MKPFIRHRRRRAALLVIAMVTLAIVSAITVQAAVSLVRADRQSRRQHEQLQATWLAESALQRGAMQLRRSDEYTGETWKPAVANLDADEPVQGVAEIRIENDSGRRRILVRAYYPDDEVHRALVERERPLPATEADP